MRLFLILYVNIHRGLWKTRNFAVTFKIKLPCSFLIRSKRDGHVTSLGWNWLASIGRKVCHDTVINAIKQELDLRKRTSASVACLPEQ